VAILLRADTAPGEKFILFVTDGEPAYCDDGNALCPPDSVVGQLQTLQTGGIKTLVMGISSPLTTISDAVLQGFANAGARQPVAPIDFTKDLPCPLLGLFGAEDTRPSPADTAKTEEALKKYDKTFEFHTYENAGHAFFAVDRPNYRQRAAVDGWQKVFAWFGKYLR
jgi:carboxymethylenebutenolidase